MRDRQLPSLNGGGAAVVTYSRTPPSPRADEAVEPLLAASKVPLVDRAERPIVPEVRAVGVGRPDRDAPIPADLVAGERRSPALRIVMLLGALAVVGGIAVLAVAYNSAVNGPLDRSAAVDAANARGASDGATGPGLAAPGGAMREVTLAPYAAPPTNFDVPATEPGTLSSAPAAGDASALAVPPTPRPRPQGEPARQAQTGGQAPSDQSDMDRLMDEIDRILSSVPPSGEAAPQPLAPLGSPTVLGPTPVAQPATTPPSALPAVTQPVGSLASAPSPTTGGGPVPPAAIPNVPPLSRLR